MLKIIKYDFMKKYKLISIVLISAVLLNLLAAIKLNVQGSVMFLGLFPMVMIILYIVDIIRMYSDDLNKKSGYMLFMTPNSGYKIIVTKVITAVLEGLSIFILYFILIVINGIYLMIVTKYSVTFSGIISTINMTLDGSIGFNLGHLFVVLLMALVLAISFILTAYTAITIRKSILSETKFGGFLSFVIFIGLNWATSFISSKLMSVISPYYNNAYTFQNNITATQLFAVVLPIIILSIIESIIMTLASGYLLEKKINL